MVKSRFHLTLGAFLLLALSLTLHSQEARRRWEVMNQIRRDKFDLILPQVMRENNIDMWITVMREHNFGPLYDDLGRGMISDFGYYIFTDRGGDRIERAALGVSGFRIEHSGAYDIFGSPGDLKAFITERDPKRIGINISERIGAADSLSHTGYLHLKKTLGEPYSERFVSAEKLVSDFRSRRVATELIAFGEAGQLSREIAERALSNEVIIPGVTSLIDVAWWIEEELFRRGLGDSFDVPFIYITGPDGVEATNTDRIIQRGDLLMIDWGVRIMNMGTDMKRIAYVLKKGETAVPPGIQNAFDQGVKVRDIIRKNIKPGKPAGEVLKDLERKVEEAGFRMMKTFNKPSAAPETEIMIGCHSVGNTGHGIGPCITPFHPLRNTFVVQHSNLFVIEFFAYTPAPEWGGKKVRIPLEDDAVITSRGAEWMYPVNRQILLIH